MEKWNFLNYDQDLKTTLSNFQEASQIHKKVRIEFNKLFDSGELKQIYEVASTKMTEYVSARSFVEND